MFQRLYEEGLAQASFLVGCDRTKQAVVVDPRRDVAIYAEAARQSGLKIVAAIETHVHADFVSGARELAAGGADVLTGPGANLEYPHRQVRDGEQLQIGDLSLSVLHTPGHTFEHISVLAGMPGQPTRLFTGDLLFVGAVGRPDLLGDAQTRELAARLYDSLHRVMRLDPDVEVHPGHGAGSLCGAGIGQDPSSTIGREAKQNPLLGNMDRDAFVAAVLGDLPETPPYFARMKRVNLAPDLLGLLNGLPPLPSIRPAAAAALTADGATVIDLRPAAAFAEGHPDGAVNLAFGNKIGYWGGWVLPADVPLLLLTGAGDTAAAQARDAFAQLLRVGLDRVQGVVDGGFEAWRAASLPTAAIELISVEELRARGDAVQVVDVRTPREWRSGHLPDSINLPVGEIPRRLRELPRDRPLATICEGGFRSSLAASLLTQEGFPHVVNVEGGMTAIRGRT